MFNRILVGVDGRQGGRDAMRLARQLAAPGTDATMAHIYGEPEGPLATGSLPLVEQRALAAELVGRERDQGWPQAETVTRLALSPGRGLHELAADRHCDLLVVGSCHHGRVGRVLLGDDTRAAFIGVPCALAIAPLGYAPDGRITLIGVGYDASPESDRALAAAREVADRTGAQIELLWVISREDVRLRAPLPADWPATAATMVAEAQQRLDAIPKVSGHAVHGGPREELIQLSRRAELLILGSRGYGPLGSVLHGSVSGYVERHTHSPLLVLPRGRVAAAADGADARPVSSVPA